MFGRLILPIALALIALPAVASPVSSSVLQDGKLICGYNLTTGTRYVEWTRTARCPATFGRFQALVNDDEDARPPAFATLLREETARDRTLCIYRSGEREYRQSIARNARCAYTPN